MPKEPYYGTPVNSGESDETRPHVASHQDLSSLLSYS